MENGQLKANVLVAKANTALAAKNIDLAAQRYRRAIDLFPAYASLELVIGDAYLEARRFSDALRAYRATVTAVPEHDQAWEQMADCLHRLGRHADGVEAMERCNHLRAELKGDDPSGLIAQLRDVVDINERAGVLCELVHSLDPAVPQILHAFMGEVAHDRKTGRHGSGNTFWAAVASILVRFGMADFLDWYTDGPAPSEEWLTQDVETYLREHPYPPPIEKHQPIHFTPPG